MPRAGYRSHESNPFESAYRREHRAARALAREGRYASSLSKKQANALYGRIERQIATLRSNSVSDYRTSDPRALVLIRQLQYVLTHYVGPATRGKPVKAPPRERDSRRSNPYREARRAARAARAGQARPRLNYDPEAEWVNAQSRKAEAEEAARRASLATMTRAERRAANKATFASRVTPRQKRAAARAARAGQKRRRTLNWSPEGS